MNIEQKSLKKALMRNESCVEVIQLLGSEGGKNKEASNRFNIYAIPIGGKGENLALLPLLNASKFLIARIYWKS